jgi:hypothetical protein
MEMSVDELIAASAELDDRAGGLLDKLAGVTARASGNGVSVEVNLDGMLVGLALTDTAIRLGATRLAAEIYRLTQQAAGIALAEGITILEPVAGDDLLALIVPADPEPAAADQQEDFAEVESWAVR